MDDCHKITHLETRIQRLKKMLSECEEMNKEAWQFMDVHDDYPNLSRCMNDIKTHLKELRESLCILRGD